MDSDRYSAGTEHSAERSKPRKIIHIDMDAFFASVEPCDNPELRGKGIRLLGVTISSLNNDGMNDSPQMELAL